MKRLLVLAAISIAFAGCSASTRTVNKAPEPRSVELRSVPSEASVVLDCGGRRFEKVTPIRLSVPPRNEQCAMEVSRPGYRTERIAFDWYWVMRNGEMLRADEHHTLDTSRPNSLEDLMLFPLQKLADTIRNAFTRRLMADYRVTIELVPER